MHHTKTPSFNIAQTRLGPKDRTKLIVQQAIGENATFVCKRNCEENLYLDNRWDISFDAITYHPITIKLNELIADFGQTLCTEGELEFSVTLKNLTVFFSETWLRCRVNGINSTNHEFVQVASFSFKLTVSKKGMRAPM